MEMLSSGAWTGPAPTLRAASQIPWVRGEGRAVCFGAAAGAAMRSFVVPPAASASCPRSATPLWVCVWWREWWWRPGLFRENLDPFVLLPFLLFAAQRRNAIFFDWGRVCE